MESIIDALPGLLVTLTAIVTAANVFTAMTDTKSDDRILAFVLRVLNVLSMNFGKNRNADDKE